jgi:hypothetical protein
MNVDEALRRFAEDENVPRPAMEWALANWQTAVPRFVSRLRAFASSRGQSGAEDGEMFYIAHLCGEKGETRAYEPLCRLIAEDPDIEAWLGDAVTETLPGILIKIFDGDAEPLIRAIESRKGDEYARGSALGALGYLVRARGAMSDADMRLYLRKLRREATPREDSVFWLNWASTAGALGYEDLRTDVAMLGKDEFLSPRDFTLADFQELVELARSEPDGLAGFRRDMVAPLDDAIGTIESWAAAGEDAADIDEELDPLELSGAADEGAPYVNPFRDVGRNDPCPCGSGKKYKKCCLAA